MAGDEAGVRGPGGEPLRSQQSGRRQGGRRFLGLDRGGAQERWLGELHRFGKFSTSARAARMGVNPRTGEKVHIAATTVPEFSSGSKLKARASRKAASATRRTADEESSRGGHGRPFLFGLTCCTVSEPAAATPFADRLAAAVTSGAASSSWASIRGSSSCRSSSPVMQFSAAPRRRTRSPASAAA